MATTNLIDKIDVGLDKINNVGKKLVGHGDQAVFTPYRQKVYVDAIASIKNSTANPPFPFNYGPDHLGYSIGIVAAAPVVALAFTSIDYLLEKQEKERATNSYAIQHAAAIYDLKLTEKLYWEAEYRPSPNELKNIDQKLQEDVRHIEDNEIHQAVMNPVAFSKKAANRQFILAGLKLHKIVNTKLGNIFNTKKRNTYLLYKLVEEIGFTNVSDKKKVADLIYKYHETVVKPNVTENEVRAAFKPLQNFIYCGDETRDLTENSLENAINAKNNPIFQARAYQAKLHNAKYADNPVVDVSFKLNFKDGNDYLDFDFIKQSDRPLLEPYFKVKANSNFVVPPKQASPNVIADDTGNAANDKAQLLTAPNAPLGKEKPWMKFFGKFYEFLPVLFVDRFKTFMFDTSYNYWMIWFPYLVITASYLTDLVLNASAGAASLIFVVPAILPGVYFIGKTITDVLKRTTNYDKTAKEKEIELAEIEAQKQYNHGRMLYTDNYFTNEKEKLKNKLQENGIELDVFKAETQSWYAKYNLKPNTKLEEPKQVKHLKQKDKNANKIASSEKFAVGLLHSIFGFLTTYFRAWLISEIIVVASHGLINPYLLLPTAIVTGLCALTGIYYGVKGVATMKIEQVKEADLLREKQEIIDAISATMAKQKVLKEELKQLDPKNELAKEVESVLKSTANMLETLRPIPGKWERRFNKVIDFGSHAYTVITRLGTGSLFNRTWLQPGSLIPLAFGVTGLFVLPYVFLGVGLGFATFMAVFQVCHNIHNQRIARDVTYLKQAQANFHLEAKQTDYLVNAVTAEKLLKHKNDPIANPSPDVVPLEPALPPVNDVKFENGKIPNGKIKNGTSVNGFHQDQANPAWDNLSNRLDEVSFAGLDKFGLHQSKLSQHNGFNRIDHDDLLTKTTTFGMS